MRHLLVTGGAGFIGSNFVHHWLAAHPGDRVVVLDKLTYAGSRANLATVESDPRLRLVVGDICDAGRVGLLLEEERIDTIVHFAAESHVDRSIKSPEPFIETNVRGTFVLLEAARRYWEDEQTDCRFLHVSTDEVYGTLGPEDPPFSETTPYRPNSPYAASKAASDHLVRAYFHTYGLPVVTTNCSNNYGPYQFAEKLIPLMITNALEGRVLPVYGDGLQVRDWLYVADHCSGIEAVIERGQLGETYNIGTRNERRNIDTVRIICDILDSIYPERAGQFHQLITPVTDRPGHDRRYAIDPTRIETELGWRPRESFESGLRRTVEWYIDNRSWWHTHQALSFPSRQV
ncbi:dTDP-glucose 4,6-dehydratase [Gloeobacter kilaueensis]|uniref:dTDP-glucose 4,6-dehydratase n=1 Tax=Gloeobacter kilaueensis (strain ATCC BAA-2537 / CCAP 1431/1 / ULC 316 / JS1) TaxID=1183438 RepID=U5QP94_GLOK1|nr:dTDP-glucose 4,6-dehydratase [Gloeobacter kilaueensis]AGY59399.1 dTDP-glucose 4,6-dehydratase [Gloeobacter kilaueensis JS1]